jgi:histidinol-phosphatase (PHP family)
MIPLDYHLHSIYSEDGSSSPQEMCRQAIHLGIPEIGFSEHWDVGPYEKRPRFLDIEAWWREIVRLREVFAGQLTIRAGVEVAEPHLYPEETAEALSRCPFDYVLGSVHFVGSHFMFDQAYYRAHNADEVYMSYFDELEKMLDSPDIDIVAHLDLPARTGKPIFGYEPGRYEDRIRRILSRIIQRSLALDINTAGCRKPAQNLMPDPRILGWYAELGGSRLTLGSDAHEASQVGLHLEKGLAAVREVGIRSLCRFERRQAVPFPLEVLC